MQPSTSIHAHAGLTGLHITADLSGCSAQHPWMTQPEALRAACMAQVAQAGLSAVGDLFHAFAPALPGQPAGITGMVLLAESHLAVHTWPETGHVTLDVFVCNLLSDNRERAQDLVDALVEGFEPAAVNRQAMSRGLPQAIR
jgi:S-adenosylmethionine decarboxylase proenzyme